MNFEQKYLMYKSKYLELKNQMGGAFKVKDWVCINGTIQIKDMRDDSITENTIVKNLLGRITNISRENIYSAYIPETLFIGKIIRGFQSEAFNISSNQLKLVEKFNINDNVKNILFDRIGKIITVISPPHGDMLETYVVEYSNKTNQVLTSCEIQKI